MAMTKRARVLAALHGEPVDRVPLSFWLHNFVTENSAAGLAAETLRLARTFDWDFLKPQSRAQCFAEMWGLSYRPSAERATPFTVTHTPLAGAADVARYKGVRALEPGYAITAADLEATAAAAHVTVQRGDLLLIRTGHMSRYLDKKDWRHFDLDPFPGVSVHTTSWMHEKQIAAVASDNYAVEVRPSELPAFRNPFHVVAIANMGLTLGEIFLLEELAADCAADGRYTFLLVAPPLPVTRAVGTPINPYALK